VFENALALHHNGQLEGAATLYREMLVQNPQDSDAWHLLGVIELQSGNLAAAVDLFDRAIGINSGKADFHYNRGIALGQLERFEDAISSYDRALAIKPHYAEALNNRGTALRALQRFDDAIASYDRALAIAPDSIDALNNRGIALAELKRFEEALACYERALVFRPDHAEALNNRGATLRVLRRFHDALASYDRALALRPGYAEALNNRGIVLSELGRLGEALNSFTQALTSKPHYAEARYNRGNVLSRLSRHAEAAYEFAQALTINPDYDFAAGQLLHARMQSCEWGDFEANAEAICTGVRMGKRICTPFAFQAISSSPAELQACSRIFTAHVYPPAKSALWRGEPYDHTKIRLGYVSGEFREHATSYLMAGVFDLHDKSCFEIFAFDNGYDDGGLMRKRLETAFGGFVNIAGKSDAATGESIRDHEIDILIDLNGFFGLERRGVFSLRPAPMQVNLLAVPATLGAEYIDYIIADRIVIPTEERLYYDEEIVYLPDSYQANDSKRRIGELTLTRAECGLPQASFVFCCFSNSYKFTPAIFDIWMRLLRAVDGSVMWLLKPNEAAEENLRREAQVRGVGAERLIFAPHAKLEEHLARQQLADVFLDTLPYNAHTTASDALWAGLPVITCAGSAFAGRVAASLLDALGLSELITHNLADYEALALHMARNPVDLALIKAKLSTNRLSMPLFDTNRYCRNLEAAYIGMWERCRANRSPERFNVKALET
jgi:protein O-GlcNAc transferase